MKKKGALKYKWQISIMTLVFFCLSLVPFPNGFVDALAETILKSPVINSDGTVTFNYQGNGTENAVKVKGEFSSWNTIDMEKGENDIWTTTVEGISGINQYGIVTWSPDTVDQELGDWQGDPLNSYEKDGNPAVVVNPQVSNGSVTLYYLGNGTETRVAVKGSFDENWGVLHEMTNESSSNIWSVTMDIEPGNYEYGIVTWSQDTEDQELGDWQGDPLNPKHSEDGNFASNALLTVGEDSDVDVPNEQDKKVVKVRFIKEDETKYDNWGFWTWYPGENGKFVEFDYVDKEGAYTLLELPANVTEGELGIIVKEGQGWDNKATGDLKYEISELTNDNNEIVVTYGENENPKSIEQRAFIKEYENITVNIHYKRSQKDYDNWNLWTWLDGVEGETLEFTSEDSYGKVATRTYENLVNDTKLGFIVKRTEGDNEWAEKDVDSNRFVDLRHVSSDGTLDIYL